MSIPFKPIAWWLARSLRKNVEIDLADALAADPTQPEGGDSLGLLLTVNHYSAPDLRSWHPPILISASFPLEIHWVVTSEWTNSGWLTGLTHWLFPLGAKVFGFIAMPAMPPHPADVERRALAVRQVLVYARQSSYPVVGLAPEGRDFPGGVLGDLPDGAGRFMHLLSRYCPSIIPVGVWKDGEIIHIRYGQPYKLAMTHGLTPEQRDRLVGETVMGHIAALLPEQLHGVYTPHA